jgi:hypothetical protein
MYFRAEVPDAYNSKSIAMGKGHFQPKPKNPSEPFFLSIILSNFYTET